MIIITGPFQSWVLRILPKKITQPYILRSHHSTAFRWFFWLWVLRIYMLWRFVTFFLKAKNWTGEAVQLCDRKIWGSVNILGKMRNTQDWKGPLTRKDIWPGGLWILPIDGRASLDEEKPRGKTQKPPSIAAATVHTVPYKQQKIKYTHQTFFAMPPATFRKQ